jgi:transcriptional regulator with XRE-family HTH domain
LPVYHKFIWIDTKLFVKGIVYVLWNNIVGDNMKKLKSNIGWMTDRSEYDREFLKKRYQVSANTISNWCTGKTYPNPPILWDLAELLDVKVEELYTIKED